MKSSECEALDKHLEEHNCGTGDLESFDYVGGFINCPAAKELWDNMPNGDPGKIAIG